MPNALPSEATYCARALSKDDLPSDMSFEALPEANSSCEKPVIKTSRLNDIKKATDVMLAMATEKAVPTTNEFVQTGLTASNPVQIAPFAGIISPGP